jgi:hypothetical protein
MNSINHVPSPSFSFTIPHSQVAPHHTHLKSYLSFFVSLFIYMCIHWVISSPCPAPPSLLPSPPQFQAGPVLPLSLILLKKGHMHNKKDKEDKAFLLVE